MRQARRGAMAAVALCAVLAGCGADQSREDARDTHDIDKAPPHATAFNNNYPNVEDKCDGHGHRVYVTTHEHGDRVIVLPDPTCPGFVRGSEPSVARTGG